MKNFISFLSCWWGVLGGGGVLFFVSMGKLIEFFLFFSSLGRRKKDFLVFYGPSSRRVRCFLFLMTVGWIGVVLKEPFPKSIEFLIWSWACAIGGSLGGVDLGCHRIPMGGLILLGGLSLGMVKLEGEERALSLLIGGALSVLFKGRKGKRILLGKGDRVLLAILGGFFSPFLWPPFLVLGGVFGVVTYCFLVFLGKRGAFPFVPSLMGAFILVRLLKNNLLTFFF